MSYFDYKSPWIGKLHTERHYNWLINIIGTTQTSQTLTSCVLCSGQDSTGLVISIFFYLLPNYHVLCSSQVPGGRIARGWRNKTRDSTQKAEVRWSPLSDWEDSRCSNTAVLAFIHVESWCQVKPLCLTVSSPFMLLFSGLHYLLESGVGWGECWEDSRRSLGAWLDH